MRIKKAGFAVVSACMVGLMATPAMAMETSRSSTESNEKTTDKNSKISEHKQAAASKLNEAKFRVCQTREKNITNIFKRVTERSQHQIDAFAKITTRVEAFYKAEGKPLANYDALVAEVAAKKAVAQAAVDALKNSSVFSCSGDDPKGIAQSFRLAHQAEIAALKEYRTAVKNLIVGVKSVQGVASSNKNTTGGAQ